MNTNQHELPLCSFVSSVVKGSLAVASRCVSDEQRDIFKDHINPTRMITSDQLVYTPAGSEKRAVVLDIDNTLTPPRRPLQQEMADTLKRLKVPFFLGAGGDLRLVSEQFIEPLHEFGYRGTFDAFLCNGPTRYHCDLSRGISVTLVRHFAMKEHMGAEKFERMMKIVQATLDREEFRLPPPMRVIGDLIIDRESMVNVAPIGRPRERLGDEAHRNRDAFREFDARTGYRRRFLAHLTRELAEFAPDGLFISLGGETSFDLVIRGNDKGYPLKTLLEEGFERVWYIGDALFAGGNDEAVLKYIEQWKGPQPCPVGAVQVENFRATIGALQKLDMVHLPAE